MAMKKMVLCGMALVFSMVGIASAQEKVSLCGTGDSQELLRTLGQAFEKANPGVSIVVPDSVGSDGGIKAAAAGECDFGRVARTLKDTEKTLNLTFKVFAFSPVVIVSDPAVGVDNLTSKQIVDIFSGKIVTWTEVGGKGGKIAVVNREGKDSSRGVLNQHVEGFKAVENPVGAVAVKTPEAVDLILKTPMAVGYLPAAVLQGHKFKVLNLNAVAPTAANVAQGKYALAAPFALVWKGELKPAANRFFQFTKSAEGKKIIIDYGTVPADLL
jgi:phosphate transport system substrate-binding protein